MEPVAEAFADRAYLRHGGLVPRTESGAVITDPATVAARAVSIAVEHQVTAIDGSPVELHVRSICIHGDTPGAIAMARGCSSRSRGRLRRPPPVRPVVMRALPMGSTAILVEDLPADPAAWSLGFRRLDVGGVIDVVPAARTVLIRCESKAALAAATRRLGDVVSLELDDPEHREPIVIPVRYDGPDLVEVAEMAGCTVDQLISLHTAARHVVAFCGFAPGFGYLRGLPRQLQLPRRSTPRTRVPNGSVAIAAEYSAVYPTESPGGWHLLGTTELVMFDVRREPPALLTPGTSVRFESI